MRLKYPITKRLARQAYTAACGARILCNLVVPRREGLAVHYGGARAGDVGGTLVKINRLREYFPEVRWGYNVLYVLSNAPYLPGYALKLAKQTGVPIVHNQNGVFYGAWYSGDWEAQNRRMARSYHAADWVFYQSEFCRRAARRFLGDRRGPGEILYNAVDTTHFSPQRDRQPGARGRWNFLITGKIANHLYYRLESTVAGLRVARDAGLDAHLTVAGWVEAGALSRAQELARDLGVVSAIDFIGPYTQQQAPEIYRAADIYVMTKHNDPCPNTVLEALATGLPILYSDSGGVPELVGADAGIALPCSQSWDVPCVPAAEDLGRGMVTSVVNYTALSSSARRRAVERFDISHWIDRHKTVFQQLTANR